MSFSLSHGKEMDVGHFGVMAEDLPPPPPGMPGTHTRLDLRGWFPPELRGNPLELEIGSGKGTFLVQQAAEVPGAGVNYIGIEWSLPFWKFAADRCRRRGLENVRVVRAEAGAFVRQYVPDGCLRQVHIYFPDPWPKKRHNKRRLIQAPFLRELHRVLQAEGLIRIVTDHDDYFAWILEHAGQVTDFFGQLPFDKPCSAAEGEVVGTNFERKYRREGRPFHAVTLRKIG
jgi:tRNA (guanine-N7-)-methyltransferase